MSRFRFLPLAGMISVIISLWMLCLSPFGFAGQVSVESDMLISATGGEHLWFAAPVAEQQEKEQFDLRHMASSMSTLAFSRHFVLSSSPQAMAVDGKELYIVLPPSGDDDARRRDVYKTRIGFNEAVSTWFTQPHDRLKLDGQLPGNGLLLGITGTPQGVVALLGPRSARLVDEPVSEPQLLLRRGTEWVDVALPETFKPGIRTMLGSSGSSGEVLWILNQTGVGSRAEIFRRDVEGDWSRTTAGLDMTSVLSTTRVGEKFCVIRRSADLESIQCDFLRPDGGLVSLATMPPPSGQWAIHGLGDSLLLIEVDRVVEGAESKQTVHVSTIDPLDGSVASRSLIEKAEIDQVKIWLSSLLLGIMMLGAVAVIATRPPPSSQISLPEGAEAMPIGSRGVALVLDLLPGAAISYIFFADNLQDVIRTPFLAIEPATAFPNLVMCAITVLHTEVTTAALGSSLGKWLLGGRVIGYEGGRPRKRDLLLRGFGKFVTLIMPLVAVLALFTRESQGLGDLMGRTFVVVARPSDEPPGPESPDSGE